MLLDEYYIIREKGVREDHYEYGIELNPDSAIFKGHFPGNPVSPGVCGIRIVAECSSEILGQRLEFVSIDKCRFFSIIRPDENRFLIADITVKETKHGFYFVKAEITDSREVLIEMTGYLATMDYLLCNMMSS